MLKTIACLNGPIIRLSVLRYSTKNLSTEYPVLTDRPQDLYVVELSDDRNIMIPAVKEFIKEIDTENKKIRVELIEGMR